MVSAALVAEYRMDETIWNGSADEIVDNSGNNLHGRAELAQPTNSGLICNAADLLPTGLTEDYLELDSQALDGLTNFTISFWYQTTDSSNKSFFNARNTTVRRELLLQLRNSTRMRAYVKNQQDSQVRTSTLTNGVWRHLAWVRNGSSNCFYLDGALTECETLPTGALNVLQDRFVVGQMYSSTNNFDFWSTGNYSGYIDEIYIFDNALNAAEVDQIFQNNSAGLNWDGSTRACNVVSLTPYAAHYFDEASWDGTTDEVADSSGNNLHATSFNADTTDGLVCRAADFRSTTTADYVSLDYLAMDGVSDFTVGMWINTTYTGNKALMSGSRAGEANELIFWIPNSTQFRPYFGTNSAAMNMPFVWDGSWHHLVWVRDGSDNCLYVDGALVNCVTLTTATRNLDPNGLIVGQEQDVVGGSFVEHQALRGLVDELLIFRRALTATEVNNIYQNNNNNLSWDGTPRICPSLGAAEFGISHDGAGIYCATERIGVTALDAGGATLTSYANTIILDTGTGTGTWQLGIGNGTLIDATLDDGLAVYTFAAADSGEAWFDLDYPGGTPSLDIEVEEQGNASVRDNDIESALVFAPTGFTVTASALSNPPPNPINDPFNSLIAGTNFDIYLTAYGTTEDDPICGVIEDYSGAKNIEIWQSWVNPGTGTIAATVSGTTAGATEATAASASVTFSNGQAQLPSKYKDAGRLSLNFKDGILRGATDAFVSKPAQFLVVEVTDAAGTPNPGATTATDTGFTAAGAPFTVIVDVIDAEGDRLPNYGQESAAEGIVVASGQLVLPSTGRHGASDDGQLANGATFLTTGTAGRFENNTVYFDETGIIRLQANVADNNYLGAGAAGSPLSNNVGRFYPDHFELTSSLLSLDCGTFAYMDAPSIDIQANVLARTTFSTTVENYDATLVGNSGVTQLALVAEVNNNGTDLGSRLTFSAPTWQLGSYTISDPDVLFSRLASPDGAFVAMNLGLSVNDILDSRTLNSLDMDATSSGSCALASTCNALQIGDLDVYHGRIAVLPAQGSEIQNLDVDIEAQVFSGGAFVEHMADSCSTYIGSNVALANYRLNLDDGETGVISPATSVFLDQGHTNISQPILLSAPGLGNEGIVQVSVGVPTWLQYNWSGTGNENPRADATFGQYRGHDRIIFWHQDP